MKPCLCLGLCPWAGNDDTSTQISEAGGAQNIKLTWRWEDESLGVASTSLAHSLAETSRLRSSRAPGKGRQWGKWAAEATLESTWNSHSDCPLSRRTGLGKSAGPLWPLIFLPGKWTSWYQPCKAAVKIRLNEMMYLRHLPCGEHSLEGLFYLDM